MSLPPFDGTGWIAGMPGLPGGTAPPVNATGADAGAPGAFTPAGSTVPPGFNEVVSWGIVANPATPWTVGQHVITADGTHVSWMGTGWNVGDAVTAEALSGWTKAELIQFAEDHDPPIAIPSGSNKTQIIALILAALESEEN